MSDNESASPVAKKRGRPSAKKSEVSAKDIILYLFY